MPEKQENLKESLRRLNQIVEWFESQDEIDVEAGLQKIKDGATLVKACKKRLSEIENEFKQIQREVESDNVKVPNKRSEETDLDDEDEVKAEDLPF